MRDEWKASMANGSYTTTSSPGRGVDAEAGSIARNNNGGWAVADSRSSRGLARVGRQTESLDRSASLNLAARAMKLKMKTHGLGKELKQREVSERRQVGDAQSVLNETENAGAKPWWKNVTMEEGM